MFYTRNIKYMSFKQPDGKPRPQCTPLVELMFLFAAASGTEMAHFTFNL